MAEQVNQTAVEVSEKSVIGRLPWVDVVEGNGSGLVARYHVPNPELANTTVALLEKHGIQSTHIHDPSKALAGRADFVEVSSRPQTQKDVSWQSLNAERTALSWKVDPNNDIPKALVSFVDVDGWT